MDIINFENDMLDILDYEHLDETDQEDGIAIL